jgi:hypothetical protein
MFPADQSIPYQMERIGWPLDQMQMKSFYLRRAGGQFGQGGQGLPIIT